MVGAILTIVVILVVIILVGFTLAKSSKPEKSEKKEKANDSNKEAVEEAEQEGQYTPLNLEKACARLEEEGTRSEKRISALRKENEAWNKEFSHVNELFAKGKSEESLGNLDEATKIYHEMIDFCLNSQRMRHNNYARGIDRLVVIYRKQKNYAKEIEVIKLALGCDIDGKSRYNYTERLEKAELLLQKQAKQNP